MTTTDEMTAAQADLSPCTCGARALLRYQPGLTYILATCDFPPRIRAGAADYDPQAAAEEWEAKGRIRCQRSNDPQER